jgi:hypothetical protein
VGSALFFPNPLDQGQYELIGFEAGEKFSDWLPRSGVNIYRQPVVVAINGDPFLEADWDRELSEDDHLALMAQPQGETVLATIAWVSTAVSAAFALYTVLTLPDSPDGGVQTSPNNNLSERANRARIGEAIPVAYGNSVIFPDVSSKPFSVYAANGDEIIYLLYELSHGKFNVDESSMKFEETPLSSFPTSEYDIIPPGSTSNLYPSDVVTVGAVSNIEVDSGLTPEYTINATTTRINRIGFDIVAPRGLYRQRSNGSRDRISVSLQLQYREIDDAGDPVGTWQSQSVTLSGATTEAIKRTYDITVGSGRYEARINRPGAYDPDNKIIDQLQWAGLKGYFEDALPVTTTTRIAVRIRSSNEIGSRALTKFNVVAQRLLPTWSESGGWTTEVATNNPAWAAADVLRNTTYGGGRPDAYINLLDLEQLASDCDTLGYECNGVFDITRTIWDALQNIGDTCNARPIDEGGVYTLIQDKEKTVPVQMFNMRNIKRGTFRTEGQGFVEETKDSVHVKFMDKNQDYRESTVKCVLPGGTDNRPLEVKWWGVDNEAQAWSLGMFMAASNRYRRESQVFEAPLEARIPRFGDLISVSHYLIGVQGAAQVSGDVLAYDSVDTLTVSEDLPSFTTPFVMIHDIAGTPLGPYECTVVGTNQIQIDEAFTDTGLVFSGSYPNPRFQIGEGVEAFYRGRVQKIVPTGGEDVQIEAVIDVPEIYSITDGETQPDPVTLNDLQPYLPTITEFRAELGGTPGAVEVHLSWEGAYSDRYDLEYSADGGVNWIDMGEDLLQSRYTDRPSVTPGVIRYRVRGMSIFAGSFVETSIDTSAAIPVGAIVPGTGTSLNAQSMSEGVSLSVVAPSSDSDGDVEVFEIWRVTSPDTLIGDASAVKVADVPGLYDAVNDQWFASYVDGTVTGGTTYYYFQRPRNRNGAAANYFPTSAAGVVVTPSSPSSGGPGPAGDPAVSADSLGVAQWSKSSGSWVPSTPWDRTISFYRAPSSTAVATHTVRGVLNTSDGTITITDQGETGEDTNITLTSGAGTASVLVEVTHISSGVKGALSFSTSQDGTDGLNAARTMALGLNLTRAGASDSGDGSIFGVNADGTADLTSTIAPSFLWNGAVINVPHYAAGLSFVTRVDNKRGFICVNTSLPGDTFGPFSGTSIEEDIAFVWKEGGSWFYDTNGSATVGVEFFPTSDYVAIGWLETGGGDSILGGGLFGEAVTLTLAAFPGATDGATVNDNIQGEVFVEEDFGDNNLSRVLATWNEELATSGEVSIQQVSSGYGDYVLQIGNNSGNDEYWTGVDRKRALPLDRTSTYKLTMVARRTLGSGSDYLGVYGFKGDVRNGNGALVSDAGLNTRSNAHYIAASSILLPTDFTEYVAYFKRNTGSNAGTFSGGTHTTLDNPALIHGEAEYVAPMFIVNYNDQAGQREIAYARIERVEAGADWDQVGGSGKPADNATQNRWRGDWTNAPVEYAVNDIVNSGGRQYRCILAHTSSGASTPPTLTAENQWWVRVVGVLGGQDQADWDNDLANKPDDLFILNTEAIIFDVPDRVAWGSFGTTIFDYTPSQVFQNFTARVRDGTGAITNSRVIEGALTVSNGTINITSSGTVDGIAISVTNNQTTEVTVTLEHVASGEEATMEFVTAKLSTSGVGK